MKIAMIGSAPSSHALAPYTDKSYEQFLQGKPNLWPPNPFTDQTWDIWGCSPAAAGSVIRATRWFETHRWEPGASWLPASYVEWLRAFRGPVYTGGPVPELANHRIYPIQAIEAEFSSYFLTSSLALMAAQGIMEIELIRKARRKEIDWLPEFVSQQEIGKPDEDDELGFWGVDMAATEEYGYQRAGCQFFILEALRRNIAVYVPAESCLLRPMPVYGICEWDHNYIKLTQRARELNQRLTGLREQAGKLQGDVGFVQGAQDDLNYMVNTWTSPYGLPAGKILRQKLGTGLGGPSTPKPE